MDLIFYSHSWGVRKWFVHRVSRKFSLCGFRLAGMQLNSLLIDTQRDPETPLTCEEYKYREVLQCSITLATRRCIYERLTEASDK